MTLLARLIGKEEGFGLPGSLPTRRHNPGDLRHAPHASHAGEGANDIGVEPDDATGWQDLERQLQLYAGRGLTLRQMIVECYAPETENDSEAYLDFICKGLGLGPEDSVQRALEIP